MCEDNLMVIDSINEGVAVLEYRLEQMTLIASTLVDCFDKAVVATDIDLDSAARVSTSARQIINLHGLV